jgi:hypothetical protein
MTTPPSATPAAPVAASPVRIPANIDLEDRIVGRFTARQAVILGVAAVGLYALWRLTRDVLPVPVFLVGAIPVAAAAYVVAVGRRDGVSLDRWALAAVAHYAQTRARPTPERDVPGWLTTDAHPLPAERGVARQPRTPVQLPPRHVTPAGAGVAGGRSDGVGVIDLGRDGLVVCAVATPTGTFALRSPAEQEALVASFAAWLHSLSAPVQILIRAVPLDLSEAIGRLHAAAPWLDHPALSAAAMDHAGYLATLAEQHDLLRHQVIIVLREPTPAPPSDPATRGSRRWPARRGRREPTVDRQATAPGGSRAGAAELRLGRRLAEAVELLAPAGIVVTPLDPPRAAAVLAAACHPGRLVPATDPDQITTGPLRGVG